MHFGDLARECQAYAAARGLGRIERHKRIAWIEQSRPVIVDGKHNAMVFDFPTQCYLRLGSLRARSGIALSAVRRA